MKARTKRRRSGAVASMLLAASAPAIGGDLIFANGFDAGVCASEITLPDGVRTRQVTGDIGYGPPGIRPNVSLTEWDYMWGFANATQQVPETWPGVPQSTPYIRNFRKWSYVGLHFRTTSGPDGLWGRFSTYPPNAPAITMAISRTCGDFSPEPACLASDVPFDGPLVSWSLGTGPDTWCPLEPDSDYYLNITIADPESDAACPGATCFVGAVLQNGQFAADGSSPP
ncbi:MAG TPA: hypothetical protein VHC92_15730 [Rhodanobacteraceae bacterium]|nr:hypothetical protein [Rhodanobacteraceae bacterium]